jgi:hypothetical protein
VVIVNDINNVSQHLMQGRLYEAAVEAGGGAGHFAGGLAGAKLGALLGAPLGPFGPPLVAGIGGFFGADLLGAVGKDMVRVFAAPRLSDDADLTPAITLGNNQYVFVRDPESGRVYWYEKYTPDPHEPDVYSSDVPLPGPGPTYSLALPPKLAGPLTDALLKASLPPGQYSQYQTQREAIQGYHESVAAGYRPDGEGGWVRVVLGNSSDTDASGFHFETVTDPDTVARLNFQKQTNDAVEHARMVQDQVASGLSGATAQIAAQIPPSSQDGISPHADNGPLETSNPESQAGFGEVASRLGNLILDTVLPKAHGADQPPAPFAEDTAPVSGEPAANISAMPPSPFTPLPSYTGDHPTLTIQPGDTIGAIAQSLDMTPGEYGAYLKTVYGPNANLNDLLPGRTLPVPPEVVERLPQFNTLTEVPTGDAEPNSSELTNATDALLQPPEGFGSSAHSFNKPITDEALSQQRWADANSYAQGTQSALSFLQAIQQGNELSAAVAGVSMLNAFSKATGHGQYFSPTTTAGLGAASAAMNLYDALKADDNLGALAAGTNLGSQVATLYAANASTQAAAQTAGSWAQGLGTAAGILGIANALKNGDETGAAISALIAFGGPAGALVGTVLAIGRALRGPKEPPEVHGEAEAVWTPDGNLDIRVSGDQNGGGERARSTLASLLAPIEEQLRNQTNAHGDPSAALIPRRLPSVTFHGQYESNLILRYLDDEGRPVERYYDGAGNRIGLDGSVESTFAEDFLDEVMGQNAIVPKWEADTVRQRMEHGDPEAWKDETLPTPEDVKGGLLALTFHIPGASSEDARTSARFDLDGDTYLDPVDWIGPYQAFLALDRDGNGVIDSGREVPNRRISGRFRYPAAPFRAFPNRHAHATCPGF